MRASTLRAALPATQPRASSGPPRVVSKKESASKRRFFDRWRAALESDLAASRAQHRAALQCSDPSRRGLALLGLRAEPQGTLFGEAVVRLSSAASSAAASLPPHRFVAGDIVLLSRTHPARDLALEGTLVDRSFAWLTVACGSGRLPADIARGTWRLDRGEDRATYEQCMAAVKAATNIGFPQPKPGDPPPQRPVGLSVELLPFFFSDAGNDPQAASAAMARLAESPPPARIASLFQGKPPPPGFADWGLNESQQRALLAIPGRRLSLVRGPPGTGKTRTCVCLLVHMVNMLRGSGITILATAFTNIGTDNILEGLLERGVNALRVGSPARVRSELRAATVDAKIASHRLNATLERLRAEKAQPEVIRNVEKNIVREVVYGAQVICATCISAAMGIAEHLQFPIVMIDESTQATEPATLCPIVKGCQQLVLFGDDLQLGPTVITQDPSASALLEKSFFLRMIEQGGIEPFLLDTQYRMHPLISEWPAREFYGSRLVDGITAADRPLPIGFGWPRSQPVAFVPVRGAAEIDSADGSKQNRAESEAVCTIVDGFVRSGVAPGAIGVISPYSAQVSLLVESIRRKCSRIQVDQFNESIVEAVAAAAASPHSSAAEAIASAEAATLTVHSVDGFQGREKEIIIFSAVRSNSSGAVGFLSDWRRMNVALTRARRGLIVVGDPHTLSADPHWKSWLEWAERKGLIVDASIAHEASSPPSKRSKHHHHAHSHHHHRRR